MTKVPITVDQILNSNSNQLQDLVSFVEEKRKNLFRGFDLNGVDLRGQNLIGFSFKNCGFSGLLIDGHARSDCPHLLKYLFLRDLTQDDGHYNDAMDFLREITSKKRFINNDLIYIAIVFLFLAFFKISDDSDGYEIYYKNKRSANKSSSILISKNPHAAEKSMLYDYILRLFKKEKFFIDKTSQLLNNIFVCNDAYRSLDLSYYYFTTFLSKIKFFNNLDSDQRLLNIVKNRYLTFVSSAKE